MKNLILSAIAGLGAAFGFAPLCDGAVQKHNFDDLLAAIAQVESGGDPNAFNERESAAGLYQIRPIYLKDVNRLLGYQKYSLKDRYDPTKSECMVFIYLRHYGQNKSIEQMAAIHNSGPRGHIKLKTSKQVQNYVKKILIALDNPQ